MSTKPEVLRLAAQLDDTEGARLHLLPYAAAELRRLHAQAVQDEALLRQCLELLLEDRNALYECHSVPGQRGVPVDDEAVPALLRYDDIINSIRNRLGGSA